MSQVTNPIILNSTGQDIASALIGLATAIASKPDPATQTPVMDGAGGVGTSTKYARENHQHPSDTSRVPVYGLGMNLLDNAYFVGGGSQQGGGQLPINQRGATSYPSVASSRHTIDRWATQSWYCTLNVSSNYITVTNLHSGAQSGCFTQKHDKDLNGKVCTISVLLADGTLHSATGVCSSEGFYLYLSSDEQKAIRVVSNQVLLRLPSNGSIDLVAIKLELGTEQTLCHNEGTAEAPVWVLNEIPDYGEELRKCQRYYFSYQIPSGVAMAVVGLRGDMATGTNIGAQIDLPVVMARVPTVDAVAHSIRGNGTNWNTGLSVTSTPIGMYGNHIAIEVTASNASFPGLTNGYAVLFSKLNLSAEQ